MANPKPGGIVNHPWIVVFGLLSGCALLHAVFARPIDSHPLMRQSAKVTADIFALREALDAYAISNNGNFPPSLRALVTPDERGHRYLNQTRPPLDPWKREYVYVRGSPPSVLTYGRDGVPGGTGDDADIDYAAIVDGR